jgi:hypothetical protein
MKQLEEVVGMGNYNLSHRCEYGKILNLSKKGIFLSIALLFISLASAFLLLNKDISTYIFVLSIFILVGVITFLVMLLVYAARTRTAGLYEELDICDNRIVYMCEKKGQKIITPGEIDNIKIIRRPRSSFEDVLINLKCEIKVFAVPNTLSDYNKLVDKIKRFAKANNISLS